MSKVPNFIDILDRVFTDEIQTKKEILKNYAYRHTPSSASIKLNGKVYGSCLRQLYYRATKVEESDPTQLTGAYKMAFGDYIHEGLQRKLQKSREISFMPESKGKVLVDPLTKEISWRVDGLVSFDGVLGGLEIKTINDIAMNGKGSFEGIKESGPKLDHTLQIISYLNSFKALQWFALVYFTRGSGYRVQFDYTRDGDRYFIDGKEATGITFAGITERWAELEHALQNNEVPNRDYKVWLKPDGSIQDTKQIKGEKFKSDFRCLYCPYRSFCWKQEGAELDSYNRGIVKLSV